MLRVTGSYSFVGDDGKMYNVNYAANEKGYQPMTGKPIIQKKLLAPISNIDPNLSKTLLFG